MIEIKDSTAFKNAYSENFLRSRNVSSIDFGPGTISPISEDMFSDIRLWKNFRVEVYT